MTEHVATTAASVEETQQGWHELALRVGQLEADRSTLEQEDKALRFLLERVIEHRQKSHGELVLLLTGLVSKLQISDIGVLVSKLVEHNAHVSETCAALAKGKVEANLPQPSILKVLDQTKRDLAAAVKPAVEELIQLDAPMEADKLRSLIAHPELFLSPAITRANRGFIKGQVPKDRIVKEFGEAALVLFNDMTTDPKLNPRPKPEEILLGFKTDFETVLQQNAALTPDKRQRLLALHQRIQQSKAPTEQARLQRNAFQRLSFVLELLHYYEHQNTEAPDIIFAQRLPALIEQLVVTSATDDLDEKLIAQAESLLAFILSPDHRLMVNNNVGKSGGAGRTLRYVLRLRAEKVSDQNELVPEFVKHLIPPPPQLPPPVQNLVAVLRLIHPAMQRLAAKSIIALDRIRRDEAEALGRVLAKELGLSGLEEETKVKASVSLEMERQRAWEHIKGLIASRTDPAVIAAAIRDRLHAKYDADEMRQSWMTLIEADTVSLIRIFSHLPYLPNGETDSVARTAMETYVPRLMHEKYAATYAKVVNSLRNMYKANPNSSTLVNFIALVKWVDAEAANRMSADVGMPPPA